MARRPGEPASDEGRGVPLPLAAALPPESPVARGGAAERSGEQSGDRGRLVALLLPLGAFALVFGMYALYAGAPLAVLDWLAGEDRPVEWAGTLSLVAAGVLFAAAYARSRGRGLRLGRLHTRRNPLLLVLALVMFFAAAEEISWGQRIFGWETPERLESVNEQEEFNLHNLSVFNPNVDGEMKSQLALFLTANRLFALFVLGLAGGWPLLHAASWRVRRLNERVHLPVAPLWMVPLVLLIPALVRPVSASVPPAFELGYVHELKESLYSVVLVIIAGYAARRLPQPGD